MVWIVQKRTEDEVRKCREAIFGKEWLPGMLRLITAVGWTVRGPFGGRTEGATLAGGESRDGTEGPVEIVKSRGGTVAWPGCDGSRVGAGGLYGGGGC